MDNEEENPETLPSAVRDERLRPAGLNQTDMEVMALHFYDCRSYAEIGEMYHITKQSVKDRVFKCLRYLDQAGIPRPQQMRVKHDHPRQIPMNPQLLDRVFEQPEEEDDED